MKNPKNKYFVWIMSQNILTFVVCFMLVMGLQAQSVYVDDALRFSRFGQSGSARVLGMGGASSALGADISSASLNPAGLGFYRQGEVMFTPTLHLANTSSRYLNQTTGDNATNFNLGTVGYVYNWKQEDFVPSAFRSGTFAISFTRLQNFNSNFSYDGLSRSEMSLVGGGKQHSIVDYYLSLANKRGTFPEDVLVPEDQLMNLDATQAMLENANFVYLIDTIRLNNGDRVFTSFFPMMESDLQQKGRVQTKGSMRQWDIAYGANLYDKIYLGASLGILPLSYTETNDYSEQIKQVNLPPNDPDFNYYQNFNTVKISQQDIRTVNGTGVNLKIGVVVRPVDALRLAGYIHTPTRFSLKETQSQTLTTEFNGVPYWYSSADLLKTYTGQPYGGTPRTFDYRLITPVRLGGGLAYFVGKKGFVTFDAEYISYNTSKIRAAGVSFGIEESQIRSLYKSAINLRTGIEIRKDMFRFRLGGALVDQPFSQPDGRPSRAVHTFTGGFGIRVQDMYADLAFAHNRTNVSYNPHPFAPFAQVGQRVNTISLTVGLMMGQMSE